MNTSIQRLWQFSGYQSNKLYRTQATLKTHLQNNVISQQFPISKPLFLPLSTSLKSDDPKKSTLSLPFSPQLAQCSSAAALPAARSAFSRLKVDIRKQRERAGCSKVINPNSRCSAYTRTSSLFASSEKASSIIPTGGARASEGSIDRSSANWLTISK